MERLSVLGSEIDASTRELRLQVGVDGNAYGTIPYASGFGIVSRPLNPTDGKHAVVCVEDGQAYAGMDARGTELAGSLKPGETCIYAPGGKSRIVLKLNGQVALVSEDADGNTAVISIGPNGFDVAFDSARMHLDAETFSVCNSSGIISMASKTVRIMCKTIDALGKFVHGGPSKQAAIQSIPPAVDLGSALTSLNQIILILKGLL